MIYTTEDITGAQEWTNLCRIHAQTNEPDSLTSDELLEHIEQSLHEDNHTIANYEELITVLENLRGEWLSECESQKQHEYEHRVTNEIR